MIVDASLISNCWNFSEFRTASWSPSLPNNHVSLFLECSPMDYSKGNNNDGSWHSVTVESHGKRGSSSALEVFWADVILLCNIVQIKFSNRPSPKLRITERSSESTIAPPASSANFTSSTLPPGFAKSTYTFTSTANSYGTSTFNCSTFNDSWIAQRC